MVEYDLPKQENQKNALPAEVIQIGIKDYAEAYICPQGRVWLEPQKALPYPKGRTGKYRSLPEATRTIHDEPIKKDSPELRKDVPFGVFYGLSEINDEELPDGRLLYEVLKTAYQDEISKIIIAGAKKDEPQEEYKKIIASIISKSAEEIKNDPELLSTAKLANHANQAKLADVDIERLAAMMEEISGSLTDTSLTPEQKAKIFMAYFKSRKVGLRNFEFTTEEGRVVLKADYIENGVPFVFYRALKDREIPDNVNELGRVTGTAGIFVTSDNKLILQRRGKGNSVYADTLGASAAGMFDRTITNRGGDVHPPTGENAQDNVRNEAEEELGIRLKHFKKLPELLGYAKDQVAKHDELLFDADLNITSDEFREIASENAKKKRPDFDFSEKFILVDNTLENIEAILTNVVMPSTHAMALLAHAGKMRYGELLGADPTVEQKKDAGVKAKEYITGILESMRKFNTDIDKTVTEYWANYIRENADKPDFKMPAHPDRFDPALPPSAQGLEALDTTLENLGFAKKEELN